MSIELKGLNKRGDTIVEVMVVLAVLGLAISISYETASRSLLNTRQAEESSYATEMVQNQIEGLRVLGQEASVAPAHYVYNNANQFCLTSNASTVTTYTSSVPLECTLPFAPLASHVSIVFCGGVGRPGNTTGPSCALLTNQTDTFVVQASWPDVAGGGTDTITQAYRVHP